MGSTDPGPGLVCSMLDGIEHTTYHSPLGSLGTRPDEPTPSKLREKILHCSKVGRRTARIDDRRLTHRRNEAPVIAPGSLNVPPLRSCFRYDLAHVE
jgi:hypothetical protein